MMTKYFFYLMLGTAIFTNQPVYAMDPPEVEGDIESLWRKRPPLIVNNIDKVFEELSSKPYEWGYNGRSRYNLANIDEVKFIKHLITSNPDQKVFNIVDLGSGGLQWSANLVDYLNSEDENFEGVTVNIYNTRGEAAPETNFRKDSDEGFIKKGICNVYTLNAFKIENLENAFPKGLNLKGNVDAFYSSWCLRHLTDPLTTIEQAYNFLKPHTGLFFGDGFYYALDKQSAEDLNTRNVPIDNMTRLLLDMKVTFLIRSFNEFDEINQFVFRKNTDGPLRLPLKYQGHVLPLIQTKKTQSFSGLATAFEHIGPQPEWIGDNPYGNNPQHIYGDADLFDYFNNNDLFCVAKIDWSQVLGDSDDDEVKVDIRALLGSKTNEIFHPLVVKEPKD